MLEHGGRLRRAAREYGLPMEAWLDLSTGISPFAWPVPAIPAQAWQRLPEDDDGLTEAARNYYGTPALLPVAGTQAAIQALPLLRKPARVGVLFPGYAEHAHAWRRAGHDVHRRSAAELLADDERFDVVVLIHPNNPGGELFSREALLALHERLRKRQGWLVVDEAFIDTQPEQSLCTLSPRDGLVVLRSVGKFFGMAGARAGFVSATTDLLLAMSRQLGPWSLSGPTRYALAAALVDTSWQARARIRLREASFSLRAVLIECGLSPAAGTDFFQWVRHPQAVAIQHLLSQQGVLVRRFDEPASLRFGLPGTPETLDRLGRALGDAKVALAIKGVTA